MPAIYAHDRFGAQVSGKIDGELGEIIKKYYTQFEIGLQGPDIFFFYRPFAHNAVNRYGNHLHKISARPFFRHALKTVGKCGRDSRECAYLCGFICHFILDSECHPYVEYMIRKTGVQHLEIEEEFEKKLLRMDGRHPLAYPLAELIPTDEVTAEAISPFYENMNPAVVRKSLIYMKLVKRLFTAPGKLKQDILNTAMKLLGKYNKMKGLMNQRIDNPRCRVSNAGLMKRYDHAVDVAVTMICSFDESVRTGKKLDSRFDRTFE